MTRVPSYRKISYMLRPAKQVERKLILETLHRLSDVGYPIRDYRYVGFGSIFFADFRLLHRYLYVRDMVCVEESASTREMLLNRPYEFIELEMRSYSSVLPSLDPARRHLVWLDFDGAVDQSRIDDMASSVVHLARGSILIVTVRAQPPRQKQEHEDSACHISRSEAELMRFNALLARYGIPTANPGITRQEYARLAAKLLGTAMASATSRRSTDGARFHPLFSFRYADGDQMYTIGGLIDTPYARRKMRQAGLLGLDYVTSTLRAEPIELTIPILTSRERVYIDQHLNRMVAASGSRAGRSHFGLDHDGLMNYARLQRHYPSFTEELF